MLVKGDTGVSDAVFLGGQWVKRLQIATVHLLIHTDTNICVSSGEDLPVSRHESTSINGGLPTALIGAGRVAVARKPVQRSTKTNTPSDEFDEFGIVFWVWRGLNWFISSVFFVSSKRCNCIPYIYLAGVGAAWLWWHLFNISVIQRV